MDATRDGLGKALKEIAEIDPDVFVMDCDLGRSTRAYDITEVDKSRFIEMGIAEQDMISTAAGMTAAGKKVFVNSFAIFVTGRCFDQVRQQVALPKANVKICGSSAGLTQGYDGATHQSLIDVGIMRLLPNFTVVVPADPNQAFAAVKIAASTDGPFYIRLSRYNTGDFIERKIPFELGKAQELYKGEKIAIAGTGPVLKNCMAACEALSDSGLSVGLYNFHTIKPIDENMVKELISKYTIIITVEEHSIYGGLGTAISEIYAGLGCGNNCRIVKMGVNDCFGESGSADELLRKFKLDTDSIVEKVKQLQKDS